VTLNPKNWVAAESEVEAVGGQLLPIGKVTRDKQVVLDVDGTKREIKARGYEHFKNSC
jgi:thiamine monophosphate kinase